MSAEPRPHMEPVVGTPEPDYSGYGTRQQMREEIVRLKEQFERFRSAVECEFASEGRTQAEVDSIMEWLGAPNPAIRPPCEQHVWKILLDGEEYACVNCGRLKSVVESPASRRDA